MGSPWSSVLEALAEHAGPVIRAIGGAIPTREPEKHEIPEKHTMTWGELTAQIERNNVILAKLVSEMPATRDNVTSLIQA